MKAIILVALLLAFCQSVDIGVNFNVDVVALLKWAGQAWSNKVVYSEREPTPNDRFVSALGEGTITACYFHKTKKHQVTVVANEGIPLIEKKTYSTAQKGHWACAKISKGIGYNKSYYKTIS